MDKKETARLLGFVRFVIGAFLFLFPGWSARMWLGRENDSDAMRMAVRGLGGRDMAIGLGIVSAIENDEPAGGWLAASAAADASDALGTLVHGGTLPVGKRFVAFAIEAGAAVIGFQLASSDEL